MLALAQVPILVARLKFFAAALRALSENAFKFGDAKISPSVLGVKSSLLSLNDGRVKDDRVEPLLLVDARLNDELGLLSTFNWHVL
jgi:hypothetical protein